MTSEIEEAVARLRRHAVEAYGDMEDDLLFAIEALSASQAEVERLTRYAEMGQACEANGLAWFTDDGLRFQPPADVIAQAAEARAAGKVTPNCTAEDVAGYANAIMALDGWQTIESAPMKRLIIGTDGSVVQPIRRLEPDVIYCPQPTSIDLWTHWRPFPSPPGDAG